MPTFLVFFTLSLLAAGAAARPALSEFESAWLAAGAPVLRYAREISLPIDIIVQPQPTPGAVPMAMGFDGGRCKLVLSMRGNAQAAAILAAVPPARRALMIEAMTAHEVGHCWRYARGDWHVLPSGFTEAGVRYAGNPDLLKEALEMRETRREEAYADLVALAWTASRHAAQYGQVYDWLHAVRRARPVAGASHDTRAWLRLAPAGAAFAAAATPFDAALPLWRQGLIGDK